ncbi:MAG: glycosyltransferase family 2 protein [Nitrospirota bacterium]
MRSDIGNTTTSGTKRPLITIVTVVFNDRQNLESTILSVLGQTYANIEYIIIDGGSTDGTVDIIRRYEDRIARWISEPDKGLYDAMNKGIGLATGDWINFMNAGDRYHASDTVSRVVQSMANDSDLIYGHCQMIYGPDFSVVWKAGDTQDLWKGMIFRHQSLFTRAAVCRSIPFDLTYRISGDFAFIYACYVRRLRFRSLDLTVSAVSLGGFSDLNLVQAMRESRRIVMNHENTLRVRLYYGCTILFLWVKSLIKTVLPDKLVNRMRTAKYG